MGNLISLALPAADPPAPARAVPLVSIRAYRKTGCAIVTVERAGRTQHRHCISLRRYAWLRDCTRTAAARRWKTSGAWLHSSIAVSLWDARIRTRGHDPLPHDSGTASRPGSRQAGKPGSH